MDSGKINSFGRRKAWLLVGLAACIINTARAEAPKALNGEAVISCGMTDPMCLLSEVGSRLEVFNQSLVAYNQAVNTSARAASLCNLGSLENVSNTLRSNKLELTIATEYEVLEVSQGCRNNEVSPNTALWLLATALVGFVGASSKRRV